MPKYRAYGTVSGGKYLGEFEATTPEEAMEDAANSASVRLCHRCAGECENAQITDVEVELVEDNQ